MARRDPAGADAALQAGESPDEVAARYGYPSAAHMRDSLRKWRKADPSRGPSPPRGQPPKYDEKTAHLGGAVPESLRDQVKEAAKTKGVSVTTWMIEALRRRLAEGW